MFSLEINDILTLHNENHSTKVATNTLEDLLGNPEDKSDRYEKS